MDNNIAIKVENLSKQYRLGEVGTGTISHDLNRWWHKLRGKPDPYAKVGEANDRTTKGESEFVWALRNIDFEVPKGEILGVIGKNGAGKSTLLKVLSKVTGPTIGSIKINGRIASLLEVGTGFHPELTGRENIFLNGAIMGMSKAEVAGKLDEIVDFAGVERYLDTPVKRYSSGMMVRLGFAVAAHMEPEILIVDEVLAVGDAEFQKKCIGRMETVAQGGRTVLFVSHNMTVIQALCERSILLNNGMIVKNGKTSEVIPFYLDNMIPGGIINFDYDDSIDRIGNRQLTFDGIYLHNDQNDQIAYTVSGQNIKFVLPVSMTKEQDLKALHFSLNIKDGEENSLIHLSNTVGIGKEFEFRKNIGGATISCAIENLPLQPGSYIIELYCGSYNEPLDWIKNAGKLVVEPGNFYSSGQLPPHGKFLISNHWEYKHR